MCLVCKYAHTITSLRVAGSRTGPIGRGWGEGGSGAAARLDASAQVWKESGKERGGAAGCRHRAGVA